MRKLYICLEKKVVNFFTYSFPFSPFSFSHSFPLHLFHLFGMLLLFILSSLLQSLILFFFPNKCISIFCYKYSANQKTTQLKKAYKIFYINIGWFMPPAVTLPYLTSLIKRCMYVYTFFFPQLVVTFQFLLVPSVGVSVPLQLLSFSPVK